MATIQDCCGKKIEATYVKHLRTLTDDRGGPNVDVDLYQLADGSTVTARWYGDGRCDPVIDAEDECPAPAVPQLSAKRIARENAVRSRRLRGGR